MRKSISFSVIFFLAATALPLLLAGLHDSIPQDRQGQPFIGKWNVWMVGKLASVDGSVINTQTAGTTRVWYHPPADHEASAKLRVTDAAGEKRINLREGSILQVSARPERIPLFGF